MAGKGKFALEKTCSPDKVFFLDFDGTITCQDTCLAMIQAFAKEGWREIDAMWQQKEISTEECANRTFALFNADLNDLAQLLDTIEIDSDFGQFIDYCTQQGYPVYILSDGYDFNIEYIMNKHGYKLPYYANHLAYNNGFQIKCTYHNDICGQCGTCKRFLLENLTPSHSRSIYVGDGMSDTCPAGVCDLVFAKGSLLDYCRERDIPATPIGGFKDILKKLYDMIEKE